MVPTRHTHMHVFGKMEKLQGAHTHSTKADFELHGLRSIWANIDGAEAANCNRLQGGKLPPATHNVLTIILSIILDSHHIRRLCLRAKEGLLFSRTV